MFELLADDTPNARKVSIMLEEIQADYKVTLIDIGKGDQFKDDFKKISPLKNKLKSQFWLVLASNQKKMF